MRDLGHPACPIDDLLVFNIAFGKTVPDISYNAVANLKVLHLDAWVALHALIPPKETQPLNDAQEIRGRFEKQLAGVIGAGPCPDQPTTVVDLTPMGTGGDAVLVRQGRGDASLLGL